MNQKLLILSMVVAIIFGSAATMAFAQEEDDEQKTVDKTTKIINNTEITITCSSDTPGLVSCD